MNSIIIGIINMFTIFICIIIICSSIVVLVVVVVVVAAAVQGTIPEGQALYKLSLCVSCVSSCIVCD